MALALFSAACAEAGGDKGEVVVGSTNFAEQEIVANMYADVLEEAGYTVERRFQLGAREVVYPAIEGGDIDVYPEYVGTLLEFLTGGSGEATSDTAETVAKLREQLPEELTVLEPADAQDANALVVTPETADEHGLANISDLEAVAGDLVLGGPPECPQRPLCIPGYEETYGITFGEFRPLDAGGPLTVEALDSGDIDVALMFTTQGVIDEKGWVVLQDDGGLQPAENVIPLVRQDVVDDELTGLLNDVSAALTTERLTELNKRVDVDGEEPADVASAFLVEEGILEG